MIASEPIFFCMQNGHAVANVLQSIVISLSIEEVSYARMYAVPLAVWYAVASMRGDGRSAYL